MRHCLTPSRSRNSWHGGVWLLVILCGVGFAMLVSGIASGPDQRGAVALGVVPSIGITETVEGGYNSTACGVFSAEYGNGTGIGYFANFSIIFDKLCETPEFVYLFNQGLYNEGVFVIGTAGKIGEVPELTFALYRTADCTNSSFGPTGSQCVFEAYWVGFLNNNSYAGPVQSEYPAVSTSVPQVSGGSEFGVGAWWAVLAAAGCVAALVGVVSAVLIAERGHRRLAEAALGDPEGHPERGDHSLPAPREAEVDANSIERIF